MEISQTKQLQLNTAAATRPTGEVAGARPQQVDNQGEKFGEVWQKIQSEYGAKAEKPREIKKSLGKDDFLRMMIVQMKNQDPTKPFDAEQMASQMAQYASVEQLQNINANMGKLTTANQPLERLAMTNMIGKVVTVDRERFPHTQGQVETLGFSLSRDAASCKLVVVNEQGEPVWEKDLGAQKAGQVSASWDGTNLARLPAKPGNYAFKVQAEDEKGSPIQTNPRTQGRVVGVSFEGSEPVFLIGDSAKPEKISLRNIVKVDTADGAPAPAAQAPSIPGAQSLAAASMQAPSAQPGQGPQQEASASGAASGDPSQVHHPAHSPAPAFFTFEKGKGSRDLDPDVARSLAAQAAAARPAPAPGQAQASAAQAGQSADAERGFPNGLSSEREESRGKPSGTIEKGGR